MSRKDLILILVAFLLIGAVLLIGAKGEYLKSKLIATPHDQAQQNNQATILSPAIFEDEIGTEKYSTSSENISVLAPGPNEIIKGTNIILKGQARIADNLVNLRIKDKKTQNLWLATTTLVYASKIGQFGSFEVQVNVAPHSGWATLEVFSLSDKNNEILNLISFPVKISPSL